MAELADTISVQNDEDRNSWYRTGTVTAINSSTRVQVTVGGSSLALPIMSGYVPKVNDVVMILCPPGQKVVLGAIGAYAPPSGVVLARSRRTSATGNTTNTVAGSAMKVSELSASLAAGRVYRIGSPKIGVFGPAAGLGAVQLNYTTDGSTPGPGSTRLTWGQQATNNAVTICALEAFYAPGAALTFKFCLSLFAVVAGSYNCYAATDWPLELAVTDLGPDPGITGTQF